jgi:eukaryotic-like serine/threonine-protein kinase
MIGMRIGNWHLQRELGRGHLGTVYFAVNTQPDDPNSLPFAAVKVLTHPATRDAVLQSRFAAEMLGLRRLTHPNIARFLDSGVHAGMAYYASEFVSGTDAATLLAQHVKTSEQPGLNWHAQVFPLALQVLRALKHAHHRSLLHRDLKPSNIIVCADNSLKVTDFGVSKIINIAPLTLPGDAMGTAGYLAPEHFTGKPLTRRSDLYALGGVLYTLLCGRPPFQASTAAEFMHKHCYALPDRPANFVPKLPPELDELICNLLAKNPTRRPIGAANVLDDLEQIRAKLERKGHTLTLPPDSVDPTGAHAPLTDAQLVAPTVDTTASDRREKLVRASVLATLLVFVVAAILYTFFRPRPAPEPLWEAVQPLIESDTPADWDKARDEYLDLISEWHPEWHPEDVRAAKQRVKDRKQLHEAVAASGKTKYSSEIERHYVRGLKLAQAGDIAGAKRIWMAIGAAFSSSDVNERWLALTAKALAELDHAPLPRGSAMNLDEPLAKAQKLRQGGDQAAANAIHDALLELYRDTPEVVELVSAAKTGR